MSAPVYYGDEAVRDLAQIWYYCAERAGVSVADELSQRIQSTIRRILVRNTRAGRERPELGSGVRCYPVVPYLVFYRIEQREVSILRILHGHRDIRPPLMSLLLSA